MERDVKGAAREMRINKQVRPHILCHSFVAQLLMDGSDISTVQVSLGHKDVSPSMMYRHVLRQKGVQQDKNQMCN